MIQNIDKHKPHNLKFTGVLEDLREQRGPETKRLHTSAAGRCTSSGAEDRASDRRGTFCLWSCRPWFDC